MIIVVPCSIGRYYEDNECKICDYGTYQDQQGQTSCNACPTDTTTVGTESVRVEECSGNYRLITLSREPIVIINNFTFNLLHYCFDLLV